MKRKFEYMEGTHTITFTFQSNTIMERFCKERIHFNSLLNKSLSGRFRYEVCTAMEFSDIVFYYRLNIKFFLVEVDGTVYRSMLDMKNLCPAMLLLFKN